MRQLLFIVTFMMCCVASSGQVNTDRVITIGQNALYFEDYMLSIQYFNQAIQAKPYLAQPYLLRAIAKLNLEDYEGAEADAAKAIELHPYITDAWEVRGVARQNLGNHAGAIDDYAHALSLVPRNRQLLFNKALAETQVEQYGQADSTFNELLRYYPGFDNGYLGRAQLKLAKADTAAAVADIGRAIELNPKSASAYVMRAEVSIHRGDSIKQAVSDLDEAIKLQPKFTGLYINRAFLRYRLDDYFGAMADYDYALQLEPYNQTALFNRALLLAEVNANDRALQDFDLVLQLEPDNMPARYMRATVRGRKGMYKEAIEDIGAVIDRFPDYPGARFMRSEFYRSMGQIKQAGKDYDKAMALARAVPLDGSHTDKDQTTGDPVAEAARAEAEKFNTLLTIDNIAEIEEEYNNQAIRGKVQDRNIQVEIAPLMELAYYFQPDELGENTYYVKEIDDINSGRQLRFRLVVTASEPMIGDDVYDAHRKSIEYYNSYLSTHQARAIDYIGRAMDFVSLRDYENALRDADRVIAMTPDYAVGYLLRAQIRHRMERISNDTKADGKFVNDALSRLSLHKATTDEILADLNKVVELSPRMAPAWFDKGNIHLEQGDYTSAIASYSRAIELAPAMGQAYYNRGYIYLKMGNRNAGIADLSKAGELGVLPAYNLMKRMGN